MNKFYNFILTGVFLFFCVVWLPIFVIFYGIYFIGKSLSAFDQSDEVSLCQTKYSMLLFYIESIATIPVMFMYAMLCVNSEMREHDQIKKNSVDLNLTFDDDKTFNGIDKNALKNIYSSKEFNYIFSFYEEVNRDNYLNFFNYNEEEIKRYEKRVVWLYFTKNHSLIGITKKTGAIFVINKDYEKYILSKNFYDIPFELFLNEEGVSIGQVPWKYSRGELNMTYYDKLRGYKDWINEHNLIVNNKNLNMIK